jgi:hypothetical protein
VAVTGTVIWKTGHDGFILRSLTEPDFLFAFLTSAAPEQPIRDLKIMVPRHALSGTQLNLMQEFLGRAGRTCLKLSGAQVRDLKDWLATQSLEPRTFGTLTVQRDGALDMNSFTYHTDSVCFADNPELHRPCQLHVRRGVSPLLCGAALRVASARTKRALQPIQSESVSDDHHPDRPHRRTLRASGRGRRSHAPLNPTVPSR